MTGASPRTTMRAVSQLSALLFAEHPGKRAVERRWLAYTLVWGSVCALVMIGGFAERWGDGALLALGFAVALPAIVLALSARAAEERGRPFYDTAGFKLMLAVVVYAFALNYTQTPFFLDVLHAHFGFHSTLNIRNNPFFLYLMTVAYFSTYAVLLMMAYRLFRHCLRRAPRSVRLLGALVACFVVAGLETALNANPFTRHLYCFDDMSLALWFGSFVYGVSLLLVLPAWMAVDERAGERRPWLHVAAFVLAAVYADSLLLDLLRTFVAPLLTTVHTGAVGLGDVAESCLGNP